MKKVIIIIAVILGFFVLSIAGKVAVNQIFNAAESKNEGKTRRAELRMSMIQMDYSIYKLHYNTAPKSWDDFIHTPDNKPLTEGVEIKEDRFLDPWDNTFRLVEKDGAVFVISNGPDLKPDTDDDIIRELK